MNSILATARNFHPIPRDDTFLRGPDLPTNSPVFTASHEQFNSKEILIQLDIQPKQVLLRLIRST